MGKKENKRFNTPVRLICHSYRIRLADTDGISYKAAIDAVVKEGLLNDDSAKEVKEIIYKQTKSEEEKTVIIIQEI